VDPRLANRRRHVDARDPYAPLAVERDGIRARELAERRPVPRRQPPLQREPGERAVHRARVEVAEAEPLRQTARDRALACPGVAATTDGAAAETSPGTRISSKRSRPAGSTVTDAGLRRTRAPAASSISSVWSRVGAGSITVVAPSALRPASRIADFTCADATG